MINKLKKLSFVIPCYRSEKTISLVVNEIESTVKQRPEYDYEIILVNDCSPDSVWNVILDIAKNNRKIIALNLAKNLIRILAIHTFVLLSYMFEYTCI